MVFYLSHCPWSCFALSHSSAVFHPVQLLYLLVPCIHITAETETIHIHWWVSAKENAHVHVWKLHGKYMFQSKTFIRMVNTYINGQIHTHTHTHTHTLTQGYMYSVYMYDGYILAWTFHNHFFSCSLARKVLPVRTSSAAEKKSGLRLSHWAQKLATQCRGTNAIQKTHPFNVCLKDAIEIGSFKSNRLLANLKRTCSICT